MQNSHSSDIGQSMNSTAVKLPQAAAEFVGGAKQLAMQLGVAQSSLGKLMASPYHAPAPLLLQATDIALARRRSLIPLAATRTSGVGGDSSQ
jgi:hypothetical protein